MTEAIHMLERHGVRPTSNRILVLDGLLKLGRPSSLADVEEYIRTMDRSSVFRVLTLLLESGIAHGIDDGSGSLKYEVCHSADGHCSIDDMHIHFHCEVCGATRCLDTIPIPSVALPEGYQARSANFVVKGICPDCSRHND